MADIQFDEEQQFQPNQQIEQKPFFVRLVLATGIVSSDKQAEFVLLGIAIFFTILAILIPLFMGGSPAQIPQSVIDASIPRIPQ